jgi:hypothetical protein
LDGLTITGGYAVNWYNVYSYNNQLIRGINGSGLCLQNNWSGSKIAVRNCTFVNNTGTVGAGIYGYSTGSLSISNCFFSSNTGQGGLDAGISFGAGLYNYQTTTSVSNCSFSKNNLTRSGFGVGIYNEHASIIIVNSSFNSNSGEANGGAIANVNNSDAVISYCTFSDNAASGGFGSNGYAGGIYNSSSKINLHHSAFLRNRSTNAGAVYLLGSPDAFINNVSFVQNNAWDGDGGAIDNDASSPGISNCLFISDTALNGGAIYNGTGSSPQVSNCTFFSNFSEFSYGAGGAVYCADSSGGRYTNCIFWKDTVRSEFTANRYEFYSLNNGSNLSKPPPAVLYSFIKSPFPILNVLDSGNNSSSYPSFVDTANVTLSGADGMFGTGDDGLRLQPCSPAIDAGINSSIPVDAIEDITGNGRIFNNTVDIGCYENLSPFVMAGTIIAGNNDSTLKSVYDTLDLMQDCRLITTVIPNGAAPLAGGLKARVTIDMSGGSFVKPYVQRYYDIEPSINAGQATARVSLYFTQADFDAYNLARGSYPSLPVDASDVLNNKANILVHQFRVANDAGTEVVIAPSEVSWNNSNNWWMVSFDVTGFGRFYANTDLMTLPVVLTYFRGQSQTSRIDLNWQVDCSHPSGLSLSLERSVDGKAFTSIYKITATKQRCLQPFSYTDYDPLPGKNYYRVKITEATGRIIYSKILFFSTRSTEVVVSPTILKHGQLLHITCKAKGLYYFHF